MWKNFLIIAYRNLSKRKGYTILNTLGLAIGIACCLLLFQYVSFEKSYDNFPQKAKQIVRVRLDSYQQGKLSWQSATSYPAIAPTMKKDFPEVEDFCRLHDAELLLSNEAKQVKFAETKGYFADPSSISMLNVEMHKGNAAKALDGPDKMIMSESMVKKYFGSDNPIGRQLLVRDAEFPQSYEVTGIFKDYPVNSHLTIDYLVSYATLGKIMRHYQDTSNSTETSFGWYDFYTYLQLKPGADYKQLEKKLPGFCDRYMNNQDWAKTNKIRHELYLLPLQDIHLFSNYNQEAEVNGNGRGVYFLFLIAFFIMAIAWINYINLASARSVERAREVGVRKVMGAVRSNLIKQFLIESLLLNLTSLLLAFAAVYLLTPAFNDFTGQNAPGTFSMSSKYWLIFSSIFVVGTLLSGLYPAFVLSGYQPVKVLKGAFKNTAGGLILRKGLIILQFATSVILIAGTIIVYQQVKYMRSQELGFNIKQTLVLDGANSLSDSLYQNTFQPFKTELLQLPGVKNITTSTSVMGKEIYWTNGVKKLNGDGNNGNAVTLYIMGVDHDFIPSFDMKLLAGRNFSKDYGTEEKAAILNESAVKALGFKDAADAIDKKISRGGNDTFSVVGVLANFHHLGLQKNIDPQLVLLRPNTRNTYSIKVQSGNMPQTIAAVKQTWNKYFPNDPFNYFFLDEFYDQQYKASSLFGRVFGVFASLAILIACFGLLGLSAYNILQRTKEIGIRKVMGASNKHVVFILSKDFMLLVFVSFLLAVPVAWWAMYNWLQDFAYRVSISWWVFAAAGVLAIVIALTTISFQALKAAVANPVKSLRSE
jgi:putative ABC transport system permease protein